MVYDLLSARGPVCATDVGVTVDLLGQIVEVHEKFDDVHGRVVDASFNQAFKAKGETTVLVLCKARQL